MKFDFEFVPMGTELEPVKGKLALDVGNKIGKGVLDHHHHIGKSCTVNVVIDHPEYVNEWITGDRVTFILHQSPDIDGTAAAYVSWRLLNDGKLPYGIDLVAEHIKAVDQGMVELPDPSAPLPYEIYMISSNYIFDEYRDILQSEYAKLNSSKSNEKKEIALKIQSIIHDRDFKIVQKGFAILDYLFHKIENIELENINLREAFRGYHPFKDECKALERDYELYTQDLHDHKRTRPFVIKLPKKGTSTPVEVSGLYWVDPTPKLFKLWARTDHINAEVGDAFVFMMVEFSNGGKNGKPRWVLSVDPNHPVDLVGLGSTLNHFEELKRQEKGIVLDEPPRSGYSIADPWYDGRGHDYTIVDTPIHGSCLDREDIENYIRSFTNVDLFFRNTIQYAKVQFLFNFKYDSSKRKEISESILNQGWEIPSKEPQEIMPALRKYFFSSNNSDRRQTLFFEKEIRHSQTDPCINEIKLAFTNQNTGVMSLSISFPACDMFELYEWNSKWKLGFSLSAFLASRDFSGRRTALSVLSEVPHLEKESLIADYVSWGVRMNDMHLARDDEFYENIIAAFMSNKSYPLNIMQSDLESAKKHIELGQYGRIITRPSHSFCFVNSIDQEMSHEEQDDVWKLYNGSCELVLLNAALQKTIIDHILENLSAQSHPHLGSRKLLDELQRLRAKSMDMVNQGLVHNLSRDSLTMDYWARLADDFKLEFFRREVVSSISELTEYVETSRSRSRERIIFILSVLVGPLTLLTDMMGGLLGDVFPGVNGFLGTVFVTYVLAIALVAAIIYIPKLKKS